MTDVELGRWLVESATASCLFLCMAGGCCVWGLIVYGRTSAMTEEIVRYLLREPSAEIPLRTRSVESLIVARRARATAWITGAVLGVCIALLFKGVSAFQLALYASIGAVVGELAHRGRRDRARKRLVKTLEFWLPTVMERVVMAVGSGLDIIPALSEAARKSTDPVSDIFRAIVSLSERGLRVEYAIQVTADDVPSVAVKHALAHLALAYKQGGEIIRPLKELSDATQTQYQESVEEEISKLPVRAVLPLVLTFTGLIVCFLTVPVIQVGVTLEKFSHAVR